MNKCYLVFHQDTGFLNKPLMLLSKNKEGKYQLSRVPVVLKKTFRQYEELTGKKFCYTLQSDEIDKYHDVYFLEDDEITRLYNEKVKRLKL